MSEFLDKMANFRDSHGKIGSDEFIERTGISEHELIQSLRLPYTNHPDVYIQESGLSGIALIITYKLTDEQGKKTIFWKFMIGAFIRAGYGIETITVEELGTWVFRLEGSKVKK